MVDGDRNNSVDLPIGSEQVDRRIELYGEFGGHRRRGENAIYSGNGQLHL